MKNLKDILVNLNLKSIEFLGENIAHFNDMIISKKDNGFSIQSVFGFKTYKTEKGLIKALLSVN